MLSCVVFGFAALPLAASAQNTLTSSTAEVFDPGEAPYFEEEAPPYRNPAGSVIVQGTVGLAISSESTSVGVGAGVGYALLTGVVPSVNGLLIIGKSMAGELTLNLMLTPPLATPLVPFVLGEAGRRFDNAGGAWILAVGGGVYIGDPRSTLNFALGYAYRRYLYEGQSLNGSGPIVSISVAF